MIITNDHWSMIMTYDVDSTFNLLPQNQRQHLKSMLLVYSRGSVILITLSSVSIHEWVKHTINMNKTQHPGNNHRQSLFCWWFNINLLHFVNISKVAPLVYYIQMLPVYSLHKKHTLLFSCIIPRTEAQLSQRDRAMPVIEYFTNFR